MGEGFKALPGNVGNSKGTAFKHQCWRGKKHWRSWEYQKHHSMASHSPHCLGKLNCGKRRAEMTRWWKRKDTNKATYIVQLFLTTDKCVSGGKLLLPLSFTRMFEYFLLAVWGGQTMYYGWLTEPSNGPHSLSSPFPLLPLVYPFSLLFHSV